MKINITEVINIKDGISQAKLFDIVIKYEKENLLPTISDSKVYLSEDKYLTGLSEMEFDSLTQHLANYKKSNL